MTVPVDIIFYICDKIAFNLYLFDFCFCSPKNVKTVFPRTPGEKEDLKPKLKKAFQSLSLEVETLIFCFSGHHQKDKFILGWPDEVLSDADMFEYLSPTVKQLIVFLDCCHGGDYKLSRPNLNFVWFTVCKSEQEVPIDVSKECSMFTTFLIQALTREATETQCLLDCCKDCKIEGEFVTPEKLMNYLRKHVQKKHPNIHPYYSLGGSSWHLAYKYGFKVEIKFEIPELNLKFSVQPDAYTTMSELKQLLLKNYLGKFLFVFIILLFLFYKN